MSNLVTVIGWTLCGMLILLELAIVSLIFTGKIDLRRLISEPTGDASMSRFQFMIFTFVIALSLFLVIAGHKDGPGFPDNIPSGIFALLGISGSSYLVSKGIQYSDPEGIKDRTRMAALQISPATFTQTAVGGPVPLLTANLVNVPAGTPTPALTWSLEAPAHGTITPVPANQVQYTAPAASPGAGTKVTIRVKADGFEDGTAVVTLA